MNSILLKSILAFNFESDSQSMMSHKNSHTNTIDNKEPRIDIMQFGEVICTKEFKLESIKAPVEHEPNLAEIENQAFQRILLDDAVVDGNEWH